MESTSPLLVTGGCGFIGGNFVHHMLERAPGLRLVVLDKLSYAANPQTLAEPLASGRVELVQGDIADRALVDRLLAEHRPQAIVHFAAESHVDRSIHGPAAFVQTNVVGSFTLLEAARAHVARLDAEGRAAFRFLQVSTDEVFGSLGEGDAPFAETHPFAPNSPYSASKAGADHLARAYFHTYGLPVLTTHCSNNYGPFHFPEKLIPLVILRALRGEALPVYGDGRQVRDWLYVRDHCEALARVLEAGRPGETYNIGGDSERRNLDVVRAICARLDALRPRADGRAYAEQIRFVTDRPGHDRRYAIDATKIRRELGWRPRESFESGLDKTVRWFLDHGDWVQAIESGSYRDWIAQQYGTRVAA